MSFRIHIPPTANEAIAAEVARRWNSLTKPPASLGRLEAVVRQLALIQRTARPKLARKAAVIFCADHGVTEEGISAYPREVTAQMMRNFLSGGAAISVLCKQFGATAVVVDTGVDTKPIGGAIDMRIAPGTANFVRGPAMTREQAEAALHNGVSLAREMSHRFDIVAVGEMGIGNTTAASALMCAFTGASPDLASGPGTGLDSDGVARKAAVVRKALDLHRAAVASGDPFQVLAALGGFEIVTMAGFLLGAAEARLAAIVDGFISSVAAIAALAIEPQAIDYLFFSHVSAEPAHRPMLEALGARAIFDLDMRLGEGSGAALAIPVLEAALALYDRMATFAEGGVSGKR
ncbi:MAG: nicotinate-nucleotide--dimethylbenzimidazole phosphoribosyltransferase [Bryobacteraceae bacterium]